MFILKCVERSRRSVIFLILWEEKKSVGRRTNGGSEKADSLQCLPICCCCLSFRFFVLPRSFYLSIFSICYRYTCQHQTLSPIPTSLTHAQLSSVATRNSADFWKLKTNRFNWNSSKLVNVGRTARRPWWRKGYNRIKSALSNTHIELHVLFYKLYYLVF